MNETWQENATPEQATSPGPSLTVLFRALGLTSAEQTVYAYLLEEDLPPAEVATRMGITPRASSGLLQSLTEKGLVRRLAGRSPRFAVISPDSALPPLLRHREAELEAAREVARHVAQSHSSRLVPGQPVPDEYVEVVFGSDAIRTQFQMLQASARSEICACTKLPILITPIGSTVPEEEGALERGVKVRGLYEAAFLDLPGALEDIREMTQSGEEARVLPTLPSKLFIIDRMIALVHATEMTPRGPEIVGVVMRHPELVSTLHRLFELMWTAATPIPKSTGVPGDGVGDGNDEEDETLVQALAAGMKDESIARQLGLSHRTVARRVGKLLERQQATSRFQTGYRLGLQTRRGMAESSL